MFVSSRPDRWSLGIITVEPHDRRGEHRGSGLQIWKSVSPAKQDQVQEDDGRLILRLSEPMDVYDDFVATTVQYKAGLISVQKHQAQLEELFIEVTRS